MSPYAIPKCVLLTIFQPFLLLQITVKLDLLPVHLEVSFGVNTLSTMSLNWGIDHIFTFTHEGNQEYGCSIFFIARFDYVNAKAFSNYRKKEILLPFLSTLNHQ